MKHAARIPKLTLNQIDHANALMDHVADQLMRADSDSSTSLRAFDLQTREVQDRYRRLAREAIRTLMPQVR